MDGLHDDGFTVWKDCTSWRLWFISKLWSYLAGAYQNKQHLSWGYSGACMYAGCNFMSILMKEINQ